MIQSPGWAVPVEGMPLRSTCWTAFAFASPSSAAQSKGEPNDEQMSPARSMTPQCHHITTRHTCIGAYITWWPCQVSASSKHGSFQPPGPAKGANAWGNGWGTVVRKLSVCEWGWVWRSPSRGQGGTALMSMFLSTPPQLLSSGPMRQELPSDWPPV